MERYWKSPAWSERLEASHLGTLHRLISNPHGECLSMHSRGTTFRMHLSDGQLVFIKRDHHTEKMTILRDLMHLRIPCTKTFREWKIYERLTNMGYIVPEIIACGYKRSLSLPTVGGLIMLPVAGIPLDTYVTQEQDSAKRQAAIAASEALLAKLQHDGVCWVDCKPEHFFIRDDGTIGLIDLERAVFRNHALPPKICQAQLDFFRRRMPHGTV